MSVEPISLQVKRWVEGDDTAFEAVFNYYRPRLLRYTFRYLRNDVAAEDLTMEVLVKIWQKRQSITNTDSFENYLFTIAKNALIKAWQKRVDFLLSLDQGVEAADAALPADPVIYKELEQYYHESLAALPEQRRKIFILHREQNLSYRQIAEKLQISPKTVENQIAASLKQLRVQLAQYLASIIL